MSDRLGERDIGEPVSWFAGLKRLLLGRLPLESETAIFILANVLDFLMTYWLLMAGQSGNRRFVEANPVARYFIDSWGPVKGLLGFKLCIVLAVCVIAQLIAIKRHDLGRAVLLLGATVAAGVVVYSALLYFRHAGG